MSKIIGIDLGTTNSCVAVVEGGKPTVIVNSEGMRTTPSVVAFTDRGERLVGDTAKRQAVTNPMNTFASIKRHMGSSYTVEVYEKKYTPQEISAMILRKIKKDAEFYIGEEITDAVITVPAYFNDMQRQATKDAGRIAGLKVRRIINEPTAAAFAYGFDNNSEQKIMVYDLGGGTFDVSIIGIGDGIIEVLATNGDTYLGGDDFDDIIINWIVRRCSDNFGIDISTDRTAMQRVRQEAENMKKTLSSSMQATANLPFISVKEGQLVHFDETLTRAEFEEMVSPLVNKTEGPVRRALEDAGLEPSDLDSVLLVGGSTRMPCIQEKVKKLIGIEPCRGINPDECVALGAALQGGKLAGEEGDIGDLLLLDVTPLSLSLETMGGISTVLIPRNTSIPTRKTQVFSTALDNQTSVDIHILQGERHFAADNKSLGRFVLDGIPPAKTGIPQISVTFDIDANGIVNVSAVDMGTGNEQHITVEAGANMSEKDVDDAIRRAETYEIEDRRRADRISAYNECQSFIYQIDRNLSESGSGIGDEDRDAIVKRRDKLSSYLKNDPYTLDDRSVEEMKRLVNDILARIQIVSEETYMKSKL